jgi:hypothetical protein
MAVNTKAAKNTAKMAGQAAAAARANPYIQRFIEDPELRDNVRAAFEAARNAYGRMSNGKGPAKALTEDRKLQRDLRQAADSLKQAATKLQGRKPKRKRRPIRKLLFLGIIGFGVAMVLSEDLRNQVLDRLFGAEEEFEYTSNTTAEPVAS